MKNNRIFWLIAILFLTFYNLTPAIQGFDTQYYLHAGENLLNGRLDCLRTPTYSLLLASLNRTLGENTMHIVVTILQSIFYLVSVWCLLYLIQKTVKNKYIQWITAYYYVLILAPALCNELATESLSMSGCIIMVYWVLRTIDSHSFLYGLLAHFILILLVFLRPTFILFFAIFPMMWILTSIQHKQIKTFCQLMPLTIVCIGIYLGYELQYEHIYGKRTTTISFECNSMYNLKRSNCWDVNAIKDKKAKELCAIIDSQYTCNYDPIYQMVNKHPQTLPLLSAAFEDMVSAHKTDYIQYRIKVFIESFDSRFNSGVNTHSPLGVLLFFWSLFLTMPLSIFYLLVPISVLFLLLYVIKHKHIPLTQLCIIATVFAQYVGIVLSASEAHARLMSPAYGLFLVILAMSLDYFIKLVNSEKLLSK